MNRDYEAMVWYTKAAVIVTVVLGLVLWATGCFAMDVNIKLSEHFRANEFACKCCGAVKMNWEVVEKLEALREKLNAPITITSGYRCSKHNREVGGAQKSQHMYGNAVDIKVEGYTPVEVAKAAKEVGFSWTKVYKSWTHIDVR